MNCGPALRRAFARRDGPTLIEVPVGAMPSPWEFIHDGTGPWGLSPRTAWTETLPHRYHIRQ